MVNTLIEQLLWSLGILSVPPLTAAAGAALTRSTEVPPDCTPWKQEELTPTGHHGQALGSPRAGSKLPLLSFRQAR